MAVNKFDPNDLIFSLEQLLDLDRKLFTDQVIGRLVGLLKDLGAPESAIGMLYGWLSERKILESDLERWIKSC